MSHTDELGDRHKSLARNALRLSQGFLKVLRNDNRKHNLQLEWKTFSLISQSNYQRIN
jgi:hypothetical protein